MALVLLVSFSGSSDPPTGVDPETPVVDDRSLPSTSRIWGAASHDFDGDGRLDLLLTRHYGSAFPDGIWYRQPDGGYELGLVLPTMDRHGCAVGDIDGDGRSDAYCQTARDWRDGSHPSELWLQTGDGSFVESAHEWGVEDREGRGRRPVLLDHDGDGDLDLYTTNWKTPNRLFLNGGTSFAERSSTATGIGVGSRCAVAGDFNGDGLEDLVVCGPRLRLFKSNGRGHQDVSFLLTDVVRWPRDAELEDIDGDGALDLIILTRGRVEIRLNRGRGYRFASVERRVDTRNADRLAIGDITGDGVSDVYVTEGCAEGRNWFDKLLAGETGWRKVKIEPHPARGCGHMPTIVDDGVLVFTGGPSWPGPVTLRRPS